MEDRAPDANSTDRTEQHDDTANASDSLPTYEETLESAERKRYLLKYPQLISRTVQAVALDDDEPGGASNGGTVAVQKKVKGLMGTKMEFRTGDHHGHLQELLWSCRRERHGFELVFSRQQEPLVPTSPLLPFSPAPPFSARTNDVQEEEEEEEVEEERRIHVPDDCLIPERTDNKPADDDREYIHRENDQPPPAYEESAQEAGAAAGEEQVVRLASSYPFPYRFDFEFPARLLDSDPSPLMEISNSSSSRSNTDNGSSNGAGVHLAQTRLRWQRNQEAKNPESVSADNPWAAFSCIERSSGRLLAEVVHYSRSETALGTLVVYGDLDPDLHAFLIVSAIPVVEEYPVRHLEYLDR
ncbi:hypothetical protein GGI11_006862 [Coemansia sp. RSA 2049]|nr:hypothetical protein GGI11_006862 [Coemansia sp. RSA 2049]